MNTLDQQSPATEEHDNSRVIIAVAVTLVIGIALAAAFLLREPPKPVKAPSPYIANLKLSDFKMSAAENFVGSSVTNLDGTVTNAGDKTVSHATVQVTFKDSLGQVVQSEDVALRILQTSGPYPEALDLSVVPLVPAQAKPFRLTFEHVTADWNHEYPALKVTNVSVK